MPVAVRMQVSWNLGMVKDGSLYNLFVEQKVCSRLTLLAHVVLLPSAAVNSNLL